VVKRAGDGAYQPPRPGGHAPDALGSLQRTTAEFLTRAERSEQLVVLRTDSGQAALLAIAIDRAALGEVLGTVAGDDTILVICRDAAAAQVLVGRLDTWRLGAPVRMPVLVR
jgi:transcriptional regulator of arginine metabolism